MRQPDLQGYSRCYRFALILLICCWLCAFFSLFFPSPASASSAQLPEHSQNSLAGSDPNQILAEAQNDVSIANTIIAFTGVFFGIIAVAATIAGFFELRGLRNLQRARAQVNKHAQQINLLEKQIQGQLQLIQDHSDKNVQNFKHHIEQMTQKFEEQLQGIFRHYEQENQKFMEASYNFTQGKQAYLDGDDGHAIEYFWKALQLQPNNVRILERLGRTYSNRNDIKSAIYYLEQALALDPHNEATLRSIALCYRYTQPEKAIEYLERCQISDQRGYEALDFLGLIHRDQNRIDEAILLHEKARAIKERPETDFYLSLLYASKGDRETAYLKALTAQYNTKKQEHDQRMRPVWKNLISAGVRILDDQKEEALHYIQISQSSIATQRIYDALKDHLTFLLKATDHSDWLPEFMDLLILRTS